MSVIWPSRDDYQNAVLHPERNLKDTRLHTAQVDTKLQMGTLKVPHPRSGNFGAVYKFGDGKRGYALKVFDKAQPDRQQRYELIDRHLKVQPVSPNLVSFRYDPGGILVNGRWYPTLVMDWVEGRTLEIYLAEMLRQKGQIDNRQLCQAWVDLMMGLGSRQTAHGDLQHGNILVLPDGTLTLVDYDGMYVPTMRRAGLTAAEIGLPAYQHPKRFRGYFDERLDNFAALVVLLCLACLDADRWERYHVDDNCLIVNEPDLVRPEQSPLFKELARSPDAPVHKLAAILKVAAKGNLNAIPSFSQVVADGAIRQLLAPGWRPTRSEPQPRPPAPPPPARRQTGLTWRQKEIVGFLAAGYTVVEIARALNLGEAEVRDHLSGLRRRAGVSDPGALSRWAARQKVDPIIRQQVSLFRAHESDASSPSLSPPAPRSGTRSFVRAERPRKRRKPGRKTRPELMRSEALTLMGCTIGLLLVILLIQLLIVGFQAIQSGWVGN